MDKTKVTGGDALDASIAALAAQLDAALPGITLRAAAIIEKEIAARAPVETGSLVRSLEAVAERRRGSASAVVDVADSGPTGGEHYAIFLEYGTAKMPAQPFFRPGAEAGKPIAQAAMQDEITRIISK